jgi:hypothetical protein
MPVKSLDDLFTTGSERGPVHPRLRRWQALKSAGYAFDLTLHRKWDGLTFSPARMFVTFKTNADDPGIQDEALWEDELNEGLVELGVRASDLPNEIVRYALAFKSAFEPVSLRHGQDYLRSVLVEILRESFLASHPKLKIALDQIYANKAYQGRDYDQATAAVEGIIVAKAHELKVKLGYEEVVAVDILGSALAQYLDEIFHISARRMWFNK